MRRRYLFMYDIASPKRLNTIAKTLLDVGDRVQESVFEAELTESELQAVQKRLFRILCKEEDGIKIFCLCAGCEPARIGIGLVGERRPDRPWDIF